MRDHFSHGKGGLVQIQLSFEHHGQHVGGAAGLQGAGFHDFCQAVGVVVVQLLDALMDADEGFAVRGQGEGVWCAGGEFVDGV